MSSSSPFGGGGGPFEDLMRSLARLLTTQGPVNWEIARQMAQWGATGGTPEANPDPSARIRLEELLRVAELHVSEAIGFDIEPGGLLTIRSVTASEWAARTLEAWRPYLESLATRMGPALTLGPAGEEDAPEEGPAGPTGPAGPAGPTGGDPFASLFSNLPQVLGPFLFGLQAGSMVGQLAHRAMGLYDLPVPRPPSPELLVVPATIDGFSTDWSLQADDVRLWVCLREAAHHAVFARSHVRSRLDTLILDYVGAFDVDPRSLEDKLTGFDPTDMARLQEVFGDPSALLGDMQTDAQRRIQGPLQAILAAIVGYVDHVMDQVGKRLIGSYGPLTEALRRRRLEENPGTRILGQLFGVVLDESAYEKGRSFVHGVVERAGDAGLARLWQSEWELPTPAELEAPGLWLARIDLPPQLPPQ